MRIAIIGAGQAAQQIFSSLAGFEAEITLIGDEPHPPYQRPPLSKKFLSGALARERLFFKSEDFYTANGITTRFDTRASAIDPDAHTLTLADGETLAFVKLVLATGSRPRPFPDAARDNIYELRTLDDVEAIRAGLQNTLVIVGGGYIGLETAASARALGCEVSILEAAPRILARVATPEMSDFFTRLHTEEGVKIETDCKVAGFTAEGVEIADGKTFPADAVIIGVGIVPNVELAAEAGLKVADGIIVDAHGQTSHPDIYAAGDCTNHPNDFLGTRLRLESVPNAIEQGKAVAASLRGAPQPYCDIPWFWSDQYDVKLQIAGHCGHVEAARLTHAIRGDTSSRSFALFIFDGDRLLCVEAVNRPAEFMAARQLLTRAGKEGLRISPDILTDENIPPKEWG